MLEQALQLKAPELPYMKDVFKRFNILLRPFFIEYKIKRLSRKLSSHKPASYKEYNVLNESIKSLWAALEEYNSLGRTFKIDDTPLSYLTLDLYTNYFRKNYLQ